MNSPRLHTLVYDAFRGGICIAVVKTNAAQTELLAQLMRAEAEGEGDFEMILVGNIGVNRVLAECLDFNDIRTLEQMVYQRSDGLEATSKSYFYQRASPQKIRLAEQVISGERFHPAMRSWWFYLEAGDCPQQRYGQ